MRRCVLTLVLVTGCTGTAVPPAEPSARTDTATLVRRAPCRYVTDELYGVVVTPRDTDAFAANVLGARATVTAPEHGTVMEVHAEAALAFRGTIETEQRFVTATRRVAAGGLARLVPGMPVAEVRWSHGLPRATVTFGDPVGGMAVDLLDLPVACEDLQLSADDAAPASELEPPSGAVLVVAVTGKLSLSSEPGGAALEVLSAHEDTPVHVWQIDRRGSFACVVLAWSDGSRLDGWTASQGLRRATEEEAEELLDTEGTGWGTIGVGHIGTLPPDPGISRGPAQVAVGTPVFAEPGRGRWAEVRIAHGFRAEWERGSEWVVLLSAAGMDALDNAWVRADAVTFVEPSGSEGRAVRRRLEIHR